MKALTRNRSRLALLTSLILAGCGGGGGSNPPVVNPPPPDPPPIDGIDRGGIAVGPIDGFGSVIVNGVRFDTSDASFLVNGAVGSQSDLSVGQVVVVVGTFDDDGLNGVADRVEFDDAVKGPIEAGSIDTAAGLFRVLGQTIRVTNSTLFDDGIQPSSILGLADDDLVEVSGLPDADGRIVATRIEDETPGSDFEITGLVSALDIGTLTFRINNLTVDYSAAQLDNFPGGQISDGDLVEVDGNSFGGNGELVATRVEYKGDIVGDDDLEVGDEIEIEGIITAFNSSSDFSISGLRVLTDGDTVYEGGTAADLGLNVRIEAEGDFAGNGTLLADKIEFEQDDDLRISGIVESVDTGAGTLQVMGIEIRTEPGTSYEDDRDDQQSFGLGDLQPNVDYVEIRGFSDNGNFVAGQLERDDVDDDSVRGFGTNISAPTLSVLGVPVVTDGNTDFREDDNSISAGDFFTGAAAGRLIDVKGSWNGSQLLADEAELEDEDELDDD
ncbi:MAG: DUF5666 domain-containing protein [Gammaproteobacteria bacterium]